MKKQFGLLAVFPLLSASVFAQEKYGTLELSVIDEVTKKPTPARVELIDAQGNGYVAEDALPIDGDCEDRQLPFDVTLERAVGMMGKKVVSPYSKTAQFYSVGKSQVSLLQPGDYKLTLRKGPEFLVQKRDVRIEAGRPTNVTVPMSRWVNMPEKGWYSADDHLHIARPVKELNPFISKWMQAEDVHVANFLQFGNPRAFHNALQYAHGPAGQYQEDNYILSAGQENPRTHFRGHGIILGANSPINFLETYVIYQLFWEEAKRQHALSGYAHGGSRQGGEYGLGVDLPLGLLNFIEVMDFDAANYQIWYNVLNSGFRMTPTAGTDYPCHESLPGRQRFFTKVESDFSFDSWLKGVREGRTFVTNGPILELSVNGKDIGEEVILKMPSSVVVEGSVKFDPNRDAVDQVDVVVNGELVRRLAREGKSAEITFRFPYEVKNSSWIALRASGWKLDEWPAPGQATPGDERTSLAHSAATYVTIEGAPPISAQLNAKNLAKHWLALLDDLEARLSADQLQKLTDDTGADNYPTTEQLKKNQPALLEAIQSAKKYFINLQR